MEAVWAPKTVEYVPAPHRAHVPLPGAPRTVEYVPAEQAWQAAMLDARRAVE